jgi:O-antigen/teichoic acid export membrane protein
MPDTNRSDTFSSGVAVLFATQVFGAGIGIVNGILLARLLGPAGKGDYYLLVLVPATAMVLLQLGLPQAFNFFSARGQTIGLVRRALMLTGALTGVAVIGVAILFPVLHASVFGGMSVDLIVLAFVAFPLALYATFTTGIVMGRQGVRWYAGVNIAYPIATTVLLILVLGVIAPSVDGAIVVYLVASAIQAAGFALGAVAVTRPVAEPESAGYRDLFGYGLRFYPGSLAGFFSFRVDVYVIALLIADPSAPLGYYSMAVGLAEMVFFFPKAVSTLFFPHVAGSPREDSDRQVAQVSRVTLIVTGAFAIVLIPSSWMMISLVLPAFVPSFASLLVLLPGVVALSGSNVAGSYLRGIGRPGITSAISLLAFAVNLVVNVILIPRYGIIGASAASLVSYTLTAFLLTLVVSRITHTSLLDFWAPRVSDGRYLLTASASMLRRIAKSSRVISNQRA